MITSHHPAKEALDAIVGVLVEKYRPDKIILFGSAARGEFGEESDLDVFVLLPSSPMKPLKRVVEMRSHLWPLKLNRPLDLIALTQDELRKRLDIGDQFIEDILLNGAILYG